jgi:ribosome biogenesis GTPase A
VLHAANMDNTATQSPGLKLVSAAKENSRAAGELRELLDRFRRLCEEFGEGFSEPLARIAELQRRLAEERFHLAVLGQFKRGKSTILNALLGEPLLPTGVVPLTSIPTFLSFGKTRAVRVFFYDGRQTAFVDLTREQASDVLARHVTEVKNPKNQLGVERVEVEHPASLLSAGVVIIDTPGIGSTLRHNTEATLHFLPQCDAALFVVSADLPITEVEKDFLKVVRDKVAKLCFVMNKVDCLTESELVDAIVFFEKILKELSFKETEPVFKVSARQGIEARVKEEPLRWQESGFEQLQKYLLDFLSEEKLRTLQVALARKAGVIVDDVSMSVRLQQRSLQLSRQELEQRIAVFDTKVKEIEQEKVRMADLLAGDRRRTVEFLESLAETLRRDARRHLGELVIQAVQNNGNFVVTERQARDQIAEEIPVFFAAKLASFASEMNHALQEALVPYQRRLEGLVSALRSTAAELFDIPYRATASNGRLAELHRPYWVTQKWNTTISPVPEGFLDRFLPPELRKQRIQKRLFEEMETLVAHNVENIRWATLRNLDDSFRRFSSNLDERLNETAEATREAMRATHLRKKQNEDTAGPEISHLGQKASDLARLENTLAQFASSL